MTDNARVSWQECINEVRYSRQTRLIVISGILWYLDSRHFSL